MLFNPLELFEINILKFTIFSFDFLNFSNFTLGLFSIYMFILLYFINTVKTYNIIPTINQFFIENIYLFSIRLIIQNSSKNLIFLSNLLYLTLITIFSFNIYGLIFINYSITSHIIATFLLAFFFNLFFLIFSIYFKSYKFLKIFIPSSDLSIIIMPLIFIIEFFSYMLRTLSLSIRLGANIIAGHILLIIIASFVALIFNKTTFFWIVLIPLGILFGLFILEIFIALIQTYVFVLLLSIYMNDIV